MNAEFFDAIAQIEKEKGIPRAYIHEKIAQALATAYRKDNACAPENIEVDFSEEKKEVRMFIKKTVVEELETPVTEICVEDARAIEPGAGVGDVVRVGAAIDNFGRIAAQTAKQVIIQGLREAERGMVFDEYTSKEHEILSGVVSRADTRGGLLFELGVGKDKAEALLAAGEQVRGEQLRPGDRAKVYVIEVRRAARGPQIMLSRTHPGLVRRLFELEVPEVRDGLVEVCAIAREPGLRTKMAVSTKEKNIDPVGACIGAGGERVNDIVSELNGEKIDVVRFYDDPEQFVIQALSPATVLEVIMDETGKACRAIVPDDKLSLAIGKDGHNVRLAARLTGLKIDIKPLSRRDEEFQVNL